MSHRNMSYLNSKECVYVGQKYNFNQTNTITALAAVDFCNSFTVTADISISRASLQSLELLNPVDTGDVFWGWNSDNR